MLLIVVALFAFCWLPLQTYNLLAELIPAVNRYKYINIIWFCSNWLAMSNSCYNPFIYGLCNSPCFTTFIINFVIAKSTTKDIWYQEKFKHAFRSLFSTWTCIKREPFQEPFPEHSEESLSKERKSSSSHDDTKIHVNGGRVKKYIRVSGIDATEQSFL